MITALLVSVALSVGVPADLFLAVCWVETGHTNQLTATDGSSASYGPCQVKLNTARLVNKHVRPSELMNPTRSTYYAAQYLKRNLGRYDSNWSCAAVAHNRGSASYARGVFDNSTVICDNRYSRKVMKAAQEKPWQAAVRNNQF